MTKLCSGKYRPLLLVWVLFGVTVDNTAIPQLRHESNGAVGHGYRIAAAPRPCRSDPYSPRYGDGKDEKTMKFSRCLIPMLALCASLNAFAHAQTWQPLTNRISSISSATSPLIAATFSGEREASREANLSGNGKANVVILPFSRTHYRSRL
jgi:hypothetical protein